MRLEGVSESERISQIHPLNARYILDTQPHREYGDRGGNLLELVVERFASTVAERLYGHGGIIALGYHDATTDGERSFHNAYLLRRNGSIRAFHSQYGELSVGMELDTFYMLLNPVGINNWHVLDPKATEREREEMESARQRLAKYGLGMKLPAPTSGITGVKQSLAYMRERYFQSLK